MSEVDARNTTQQGQYRYHADADWGVLEGVHIYATWPTRLNPSWAVAL